MIMNRDEVLRMILSKNITPAEFDFNKLSAPPIEYFLSYEDISRLIYLANNPRFSAKIDYKYSEIDKIMRARGFELLGRGTNRVVYKYLENNTICMKIAVDHIGASDNPREFINQEYLKPFVSKVFHVDPTGTVAVCERVHGIQTREEFLQYAPGIFDLIFKWFTGKYVVNDIGSKFFMNWGIRYSTGIPVLLDYPYFYELDIRKARCMAILDDGSFCGGDIDYDDGYNYLYCTKCGAKYRAIELAKDISSGAVRIIDKGDTKRMKITLKKNGEVFKEINVTPETKKIDEEYAKQQIRAKAVIKKVVEQEKEVDKATTAKNEEKSKVVPPQVRIKSTTGRVSIVINKPEISENKNKSGSFIPKDNNNRNKQHKKATKKISVNLNTGTAKIISASESNIHPQVKVKNSEGKAVVEEEIVKAAKIEPKLEDTKNDVVTEPVTTEEPKIENVTTTAEVIEPGPVVTAEEVESDEGENVINVSSAQV